MTKDVQKKLFRSRKDRVFTGVLGGVGEYLGVDPNVVRVVYIILTFLSGIGPLLLAYLLMVIVVPEEK
ncbi:MAG: PspC domain-containing protein [Candidatus Altiarchaeota archaeon]